MKSREGEDITLLLQFINTSKSLKRLRLLWADERSAACTGQFLQAAGGNSAIIAVTLSLLLCSCGVFRHDDAHNNKYRRSRTFFLIVRTGDDRNRCILCSIDEQLSSAFTSNRTLKRLHLYSNNEFPPFSQFKSIVSALKESTSAVESILLGDLTQIRFCANHWCSVFLPSETYVPFNSSWTSRRHI